MPAFCSMLGRYQSSCGSVIIGMPQILPSIVTGLRATSLNWSLIGSMTSLRSAYSPLRAEAGSMALFSKTSTPLPDSRREDSFEA